MTGRPKVDHTNRIIGMYKVLESIAEMFGVSNTVISNIKHGKTWKNVDY